MSQRAMVSPTHIFFIFLLLVWSSCQSDQHRRQVMIRGMEEAVRKNTADQFVRPLVANYIQYATDYLDDDLTPYYLYKAAVLYFRVGNQGEAIAQLERIVREYPDCEIIEDVYLSLGMMCATGGYQQDRTEEIYAIYSEKFPDGKGLRQIELYYADPVEKLKGRIYDLQQRLKSGTKLGVYNKELSNQLLWVYIDYIKLDSTYSEMSVNTVWRSVGYSIRVTFIAIELLDHIIRHDSDKAYTKALFILANEYSGEINRYLNKETLISSSLNNQINSKTIREIDHKKEALLLYQQLIKEYPDHHYSKTASDLLKNQ